jgi:sulfur-oxidizing protein SoxY
MRQRLKNRRTFLQAALAIFGGLFAPISARAEWTAQFFATGSFNDSLKNLNLPAVNTLSLSDKIALQLPSIAENGAVVPLTIQVNLENVDQLFVFVEKNPVPLAAIFNLSPEVEATVSTRLKMAETSPVVVLAKAEGQFYKAQQVVKVTIGGCGG